MHGHLLAEFRGTEKKTVGGIGSERSELDRRATTQGKVEALGVA